MTSRTVRAAGAILATAALIALGTMPAAATVPGEGAVIFNPDGTPIGSELVYGASNTPQFVYTSETQDDDYWGLDVDGEPADEEGMYNAVETGVPLGFTINVNGIVYDEVIVNSNGGVCLVSSTDPDATQSFDQCDGFYDEPMGYLVDDPDYAGGPNDYAAFLPFNQDLYPPYADTPVDTDADTVPDECALGAFLFEFETDFYCSTVFWGTTTYEGKPAFVATWYHDPDISASPAEGIFNTLQVLLVNDGAGNVTVVYNYDDVLNSGENLDYGVPNNNAVGEACGVQYDGGDTAEYLFGGLIGTNFAEASPLSLALFGPTCDTPVVYPEPAANLVNGGSFALIDHSLNSAVPGRYVFRVIDGLPDLTLAAAAPALAATGTDASVPLFVGLSVLLVGGMLLVRRRTAKA